MEESGWIRRGMFVAGLGAAQFAMTSAVDMLRTLRTDPERAEVVHIAASDPANPYGTVLPWPREESGEAHAMSRSSGASVILVNGRLAAFLRRRNPAIRVFLPENEPERSQMSRELAKKLAEVAIRRQGRRTGLLIGEIEGVAAGRHFLARFLEDAGFVATAVGFQMRRVAPVVEMPEGGSEDDEESA
jgi:ATP-dependent Lhr-like helicase